MVLHQTKMHLDSKENHHRSEETTYRVVKSVAGHRFEKGLIIRICIEFKLLNSKKAKQNKNQPTKQKQPLM